MFARSNFVQNSLSKVHEETKKTDAELLAEFSAERQKVALTLEEEFGTSGFFHYYGKASFFCRKITGEYESYFIGTIIMAIVLAGVLVGIDTYDAIRDWYIFSVLETVVLAVFVLECVIKIIAEGKEPGRFFVGEEGAWNTFDFIVVVFCMPFFSDIFGNNSPAIRIVSRLFRLFRVAKIVHQIPALQVIVKGLIGGLKSIVYVATLLVLVFYLYAIFGVYIFRENDPFFFGSVSTGLLSLFRACTLENWGDNMYVNMYGCREYDAGIYMSESDMNDAGDWEKLPSMYKCEQPNPQPALAGLFWISFTVISSLVMLSLFIGVITMSMQESLNDMRREVEETNRMKRLIKAEEEMAAAAAKNKALEVSKQLERRASLIRPDPSSDEKQIAQNESSLDSDDDDDDEDDDDDLPLYKRIAQRIGKWLLRFKPLKNAYRKVFPKRHHKKLSSTERKALADMAELKTLMMQAWHGTKASNDYHHNLDVTQDGVEKYIRHAGVFSRKVCENTYFTNFITLVILVTAVIVGVETDYRTPENGAVFDVLENIIFAIFATEVVLRFLAEDCVPHEYFASGWNTFDFLVVCFSKIPGGGAVIVMLRLVRLLRVLKLVKSLPQLAVIVNALLMGLSSIGYIGIIMFLTFYLFAILGIILFKDNDSFNFGTLHQAMVALFKVATLDNWGDILYLNIFGCDVYPPSFAGKYRMVTCDSPYAQPVLATVYFALFVVVGSLVMITLFVGVVTTSMEEATRMQTVELEIETRILDLCHERAVTNSQLDIYRRVFSMLDLDGGGTIEGEEMRTGLQAVNIECTDEQLDIWIREVDENSDGVIDLIEFIIFMTNMKQKALKEAEEKAMRRGANAFLKMRDRAKARKAGLLPSKDSPDSSPNSKDSLKAVKKPPVPLQKQSSFASGLIGGLKRMGSVIIGVDASVDEVQELDGSDFGKDSRSNSPVQQ